MVTPRTSSNGWFGSASAAARPLLTGDTALMPPATGKADFDGRIAPLPLRYSTIVWFGSASAAARPLLPADTALMPPAPGNADFDASIAPLAISCFLPTLLLLFFI